MLEHNIDARGALFLVFVDDDDGFGRVGHGLVDNRGGIFGVRNRTEELFDHRFGVIDIDIAHDYDTLIRRMVPFFVIVANFLRLEVVDDRHQANRIAHAILRTRIEGGQVALEHTARRRCAHTPFLVNHTALLVDFIGIERQTC